MWHSRCSFIKSCDVIIATYVVAPRKVNANPKWQFAWVMSFISTKQTTYNSYG